MIYHSLVLFKVKLLLHLILAERLSRLVTSITHFRRFSKPTVLRFLLMSVRVVLNSVWGRLRLEVRPHLLRVEASFITSQVLALPREWASETLSHKSIIINTQKCTPPHESSFQ